VFHTSEIRTGQGETRRFSPPAGGKTEENMEAKIKAALEDIRPMLLQDGGDVEFVEFTNDNRVIVRLQGHCAGCPYSQMTVKNGIERILKEQYPEIKSVESVN
jgi:Fe-S cluster biogenesis protein NfuA